MVLRRAYAVLLTDRHNVLLLQRRMFTAKQSRTEGGGRLGCECKGDVAAGRAMTVEEANK